MLDLPFKQTFNSTRLILNIVTRTITENNLRNSEINLYTLRFIANNSEANTKHCVLTFNRMRNIF